MINDMQERNELYYKVKFIIDKYGHKLNNEKEFLMAYWKVQDEVVVDKENFNTKSFLSTATNPSTLLSYKRLIESEEDVIDDNDS